MFKVNIRNTRKRCEIRSKLTIKTPTRRQVQEHQYESVIFRISCDFSYTWVFSTSFWCLYCELWTNFAPFSIFAIADFEHVNDSWVNYLCLYFKMVFCWRRDLVHVFTPPCTTLKNVLKACSRSYSDILKHRQKVLRITFWRTAKWYNKFWS